MVDNSLNLGIANVASEEFGEPRSSRPRIQSRTLYLLLNSASAIQRLVDERNALRRRVDTLERELTLLGIKPPQFSIAIGGSRQNS
jgi:hypothetical protein